MKFTTLAVTAIFFQAAFAAPYLETPASDNLSERSTEHNEPHAMEHPQGLRLNEPKFVWNPPHRVQSVPHGENQNQHYRRGWWGGNDWDDDRYDGGYSRKWWGGKDRGYGYRKNRWGGDRWGYKGGRRYGAGYGWDNDRDYGYGW